jgi:hypothetical protein
MEFLPKSSAAVSYGINGANPEKRGVRRTLGGPRPNIVIRFDLQAEFLVNWCEWGQAAHFEKSMIANRPDQPLTSTSPVLGDHTYTPNSLNQYATLIT